MKTVRSEMDAAEHDLDNGLSDERGYGPQARAALSRFSRAAQDLRKTSLLHAFELRTALDGSQLQNFDFAIRRAWSAEAL